MVNRSSGSGFSHSEYEHQLREAITAVKNGRRGLARRLLHRAAHERPGDARPWLWLSATTDDPEKQYELLSRAVALDPMNSAARQGLVKLNVLLGKAEEISSREIMEENRSREAPEAPEEAVAESFLCASCGGRMHFDVSHRNLVCEFCGRIQETRDRQAADEAEQGIDYILYSGIGHDWARAQQQVECGRCGSKTLLNPEHRTTRCPYCGSNQLVASSETEGLIEPQVIALINIDQAEAHRRAREWFSEGLFTPGDLQDAAEKLRLRPAYYPFWTFDGTLEANWNCEVRTTTGGISGTRSEWQQRSGGINRFFDDVVVPGAQAVRGKELEGIEPFNLKDLVAFEPEHLAGWPTLRYDLSLADASLRAREKVMKQLRREARHEIEPGSEKRNLRIGAGSWSGMSYKHVLLPVWVGTYFYEGEEHHILVNGQTGKVGGSKPSDAKKTYLVWGLIGLLVLVIAAILIPVVGNYVVNLLTLWGMNPQFW